MKARALDEVTEEVDRLLLAGEFDRAVELLDQSHRQDLADHVLAQRLGDLYRALERPDEALAAYDEAISAAPDSGELWAKKGDALIDAGRPDEAVDAFKKASELTPNEFSAADWNLRGDRCYSYMDYETAAQLYESSLALEANVEAWRGLGLVAWAQGNYAGAMRSYREGLELDPTNVDLLNDLGLAHYTLDEISEARTCFEQVVALHPQSLEGWFNLGLVHRESRNFEAAYDACVHATELAPEHADVWIELGLSELELGDRQSALRNALISFERAIELDEYSFWGWNNAGSVLAELKQYDAALTRLDRAIELGPFEVNPWNSKVFMLLDQGKFEQADACVEEMLSAVADRGEALNIKALTFMDWKGNDKEALKVLRQASKLKPDDPSIGSNLAEVLLKLGEYAESRKRARALLKMDADEDQRCALLFVIYAAYVLEGGSPTRRSSAFHEFIEYYRSQYVGDERRTSTWNYRGLVQIDQPEPCRRGRRVRLSAGDVARHAGGYLRREDDLLLCRGVGSSPVGARRDAALRGGSH